MPRIPAVDAELCNHCGYCAAHCPAGAIAKGDECNTDAEKCIRCCACVKAVRKKPVLSIRRLQLCLPTVLKDRKKTGLSCSFRRIVFVFLIVRIKQSLL